MRSSSKQRKVEAHNSRNSTKLQHPAQHADIHTPSISESATSLNQQFGALGTGIWEEIAQKTLRPTLRASLAEAKWCLFESYQSGLENKCKKNAVTGMSGTLTQTGHVLGREGCADHICCKFQACMGTYFHDAIEIALEGMS
eukprot:624557-Pelagomonas_calceolata.AAC.7